MRLAHSAFGKGGAFHGETSRENSTGRSLWSGAGNGSIPTSWARRRSPSLLPVDVSLRQEEPVAAWHRIRATPASVFECAHPPVIRKGENHEPLGSTHRRWPDP